MGRALTTTVGAVLAAYWTGSFMPARTSKACFLGQRYESSRLADKMVFLVKFFDVKASDALKGVRLRCVHFDIEPEITAPLAKAGHKIDIPISFNPPWVDKGKKISWVDGIEAIYTLLRVRFSK